MATPSNQQIISLLFCIAPQFQTTDEDTLECYDTIIDNLRCQINTSILKCCQTLAFAYLLAHMLTLRSSPQSGIASSLREGDLSISFAITAESSFLQLTPWGKAFLDLIKRSVFAPTISNLPSNFNPLSLYGQCC